MGSSRETTRSSGALAIGVVVLAVTGVLLLAVDLLRVGYMLSEGIPGGGAATALLTIHAVLIIVPAILWGLTLATLTTNDPRYETVLAWLIAATVSSVVLVALYL